MELCDSIRKIKIWYLFVSRAILDSEDIYLFNSYQDWWSSSQLDPGFRKLSIWEERLVLNKWLEYSVVITNYISLVEEEEGQQGFLSWALKTEWYWFENRAAWSMSLRHRARHDVSWEPQTVQCWCHGKCRKGGWRNKNSFSWIVKLSTSFTLNTIYVFSWLSFKVNLLKFVIMGMYNCPSSYNISHVCYAVDTGFGVKQASLLFEGVLLLFPFYRWRNWF